MNALHDAGRKGRAGQDGGGDSSGDASGSGGATETGSANKGSAAWSNFGRDPQGTRRSPADTSTTTGKLKWRYPFNTNGSRLPSPTVGPDGTVYVCSSDDILYAVGPNATDTQGVLKWRYQDLLMASSAALAADGTVYLLTSSGLNALVPPGEGDHGVLAWSFKAPEGLHFFRGLEPTVGEDGTVYLSTSWGLYAISPPAAGTSAVVKWRYDNIANIASSPSVGPDGTVYLGAPSGTVLAISPPASGDMTDPEWNYRLEEAATSLAVGSDGTLYFFSREGKLSAISPPAAGEESGSLKWSYKTAQASLGEVTPTPALAADGTVYVVGSDTLYAISPPASGNQGVLKWTFAPGGDVESSPSIGGDGTVYVCSKNAYLYAVSASGKQKWATLADCIDGSPAIGPDGTVYVVGGDGLYAIH